MHFLVDAQLPPAVANTTRPEVLARFERHLSGILEALQRGETLVEID